jgi:hypothetical protein
MNLSEQGALSFQPLATKELRADGSSCIRGQLFAQRCYEVMSIPPKLQHSVTARIKLLADLNIAENRLLQDACFSVKLNDQKIDFRAATLPTAFGEKIVLRLLDTVSVEADLAQETTDRANHLASLREVKQPSGVRGHSLTKIEPQV